MTLLLVSTISVSPISTVVHTCLSRDLLGRQHSAKLVWRAGLRTQGFRRKLMCQRFMHMQVLYASVRYWMQFAAIFPLLGFWIQRLQVANLTCVLGRTNVLSTITCV